MSKPPGNPDPFIPAVFISQASGAELHRLAAGSEQPTVGGAGRARVGWGGPGRGGEGRASPTQLTLGPTSRPPPDPPLPPSAPSPARPRAGGHHHPAFRLHLALYAALGAGWLPGLQRGAGQVGPVRGGLWLATWCWGGVAHWRWRTGAGALALAHWRTGALALALALALAQRAASRPTSSALPSPAGCCGPPRPRPPARPCPQLLAYARAAGLGGRGRQRRRPLHPEPPCHVARAGEGAQGGGGGGGVCVCVCVCWGGGLQAAGTARQYSLGRVVSCGLECAPGPSCGRRRPAPSLLTPPRPRPDPPLASHRL